MHESAVLAILGIEMCDPLIKIPTHAEVRKEAITIQ